MISRPRFKSETKINRYVAFHGKSKHDPIEPDLAKKEQERKDEKKSEKIIVASNKEGGAEKIHYGKNW